MVFTEALLSEFDAHCTSLRKSARERREAIALRNVVMDRTEVEALDMRSTFGVLQANEKWAGDAALRTLRSLLHIIDENGFERCVCACPFLLRRFAALPTDTCTRPKVVHVCARAGVCVCADLLIKCSSTCAFRKHFRRMVGEW
jgi:hypothetical protein